MNHQRTFLRILALCYALGFMLHVLDLFDLRLRFSEMTLLWKAWIVFLAVFDLVAAAGLWNSRGWGVAAFLLVTVSQLIAYLGFSDFFGEQSFLVWFHVFAIVGFGVVSLMKHRSLELQSQDAAIAGRNA